MDVMALLSGTATSIELLKTVKEIKENQEYNAAVVALNDSLYSVSKELISLQSLYAQALKEKGELEERLGKMEHWEADKERYEMQEIFTGAFAYALKPSMKGEEPEHYLCANCYTDGKKSILQPGQLKGYKIRTHSCPRCKNVFPTMSRGRN
ncbi:hypothetical protein [Cohaesibacter gelatinilyticus]|uniref:Uncharacterized protein n=1 Tax=Cohaesibacter gelatinilyticus TaxID=372072 RepID=A0A285PGU3_9HYPH|nr:hypothetical protein [Cohaesibacter gelatinilyticus]SNZ20924.1 hypothetical protein SAMN06265368_4038 [Cohaesibacter gelatinilyticus]